MIEPSALSVSYEFTTLLAVAAVMGLLCRLLHQPLLVGFIATGIIVGPIGLGIAATGEHVVLLSELGVTLLLFLVGLKLDLHLVWMLGGVALLTGLGHELGALLVGAALAWTPHRETVVARPISLRDFLPLFFFVVLGAGVDLAGVGEALLAAFVLWLAVPIGLGRYGQALAETLLRHDVRLPVTDRDPQIVARWRRDDRAARPGDALDPDLAASLPLANARLVIDAVPYHGSGVVHADHRLALLRALREAGYRGRVAARSDDEQEVRRLATGGIDPVLRPFHDAAEHVAGTLLELVTSGGPRRAGTAATRPGLAHAATAEEM